MRIGSRAGRSNAEHGRPTAGLLPRPLFPILIAIRFVRAGKELAVSDTQARMKGCRRLLATTFEM